MVLTSKKLASIVVMAICFWCVLLIVHSPDAFASMSDIRGHWAEESIEDLIDQGIFSGYPDGRELNLH
ncbi:MAG TPA: S-layer homology domain-containing protein [Tepidanaerobacteraceae bacterium]|nr:S-layer homology domain-containing protein [Tepidanaerobacteraceae bacterium]